MRPVTWVFRHWRRHGPRRGGADLQGVIERTRQARQEVRQWFVVDTLEYLRRGGRVGTAAAWIGSALDLKPILMVESELKAVERVRTLRRGVERLIELMRQRRAVGADRWFVQHAYAHEEAQRCSWTVCALCSSAAGVRLRARPGTRNAHWSGDVVGRRTSQRGVGIGDFYR